MKVCIINNIFRPYSRGGADKIAVLIADGLKKNGHEIFSISTKPAGDKIGEKYYLNSCFHYLNKIPKIFRFFWHIGDLFNVSKFFKINKILKKEKPDLVITHNLKGIGMLSFKAIKKNKIKHIHYLHDIQLLHPSGLMIWNQENKIKSLSARIYSRLCSKMAGSPDMVVSPSRWLMDLYSLNGFFKNSTKKIILNPISKINFTLSHKNNTESIFKFLYVGEIEEQKGIILLVKAFLILSKKIRDQSELIVVGVGSQKEEVKRFAKKEKNIKLLGWKENSQVKKLMSESSLLIIPSICYDNSPTVIYEAAVVGLPVLGANLGGIPELIKKFGGDLFYPGNKKDLTLKMERSFLSRGKNFNKNSAKLILQKLEVENYLKILFKN